MKRKADTRPTKWSLFDDGRERGLLRNGKPVPLVERSNGAWSAYARELVNDANRSK